jgi:hypothetical protein
MNHLSAQQLGIAMPAGAGRSDAEPSSARYRAARALADALVRATAGLTQEERDAVLQMVLRGIHAGIGGIRLPSASGTLYGFVTSDGFTYDRVHRY